MAKGEGHAAPGGAGGDKELEGIKSAEPPLCMRDRLGSIQAALPVCMEYVVAPRAYWKGYLKLSLVSCPVALFPASSEREKISFNGFLVRDIAVADLPLTSLIAQNQAFIAWFAISRLLGRPATF